MVGPQARLLVTLCRGRELVQAARQEHPALLGRAIDTHRAALELAKALPLPVGPEVGSHTRRSIEAELAALDSLVIDGPIWMVDQADAGFADADREMGLAVAALRASAA